MNHLHNACESVDASVFSSDMLFDDERRAELKEYIGRWTRAIKQHEAGEAPAVTEPPVYVVVCQNDKPHPRWGKDEGGPIVHETYTRGATLEAARKRSAMFEQHGACRVARLVFEDIDGRPL